MRQVSSPYLSESAHVFSLQNPMVSMPNAASITAKEPRYSNESGIGSPNSSGGRLCDVLETTSEDSIDKTPTRKSSSVVTTVSARAFYLKVKREIEAKLKHTSPVEKGGSVAVPAQNVPSKKHRHPCEAVAANIKRDRGQSRSSVDSIRNFLFPHSVGKTGVWLKDELGPSRITRKLFGKAPWHRKESAESYNSVSSSIRDVLKGRTPPATPVSTATVTYMPSIQFPGGEAVRVSTPPLDEDTADGKPRGFFTTMTPPVPDGDVAAAMATSKIMARSSPRYSIHGNSMSSQPREWWEQRPQRISRRDIFDPTLAMTNGGFEFDVPEHLPSSPMCPANSRHTSGGTGMCVYHGRRRANSLFRGETSSGDASSSWGAWGTAYGSDM